MHKIANRKLVPKSTENSR